MLDMWDPEDFTDTKDDTGKGWRRKEFSDINAFLNLLLNDVHAAGKALTQLRTIGHEVIRAIIFMLENKYPYLALCSNYWKAKRDDTDFGRKLMVSLLLRMRRQHKLWRRRSM
ncbi:hypothetical protein R3P38DRAFT_3461583 [Favolaschia claudopus]|uniref:Uncharacterized protein n=1 Tax=Favolaschia claudopus TaxID=2862362 RepID=A0AAW0CPW4_9AGAR